MRTALFCLVALSALLGPGCNPVKSTAAADAGVADFHANFDAENIGKIYDSAHPEFRSMESKEKVVGLIGSMRQHFGKTVSTKRTGWNANSSNFQTNMVLTYDTEFEKGSGVETFTFRIEEGNAFLLGWHINSNETLKQEQQQQKARAEQADAPVAEEAAPQAPEVSPQAPAAPEPETAPEVPATDPATEPDGQ